jgi:hypothetical protein
MVGQVERCVAVCVESCEHWRQPYHFHYELSYGGQSVSLDEFMGVPIVKARVGASSRSSIKARSIAAARSAPEVFRQGSSPSSSLDFPFGQHFLVRWRSDRGRAAPGQDDHRARRRALSAAGSFSIRELHDLDLLCRPALRRRLQPECRAGPLRMISAERPANCCLP